MRVLIALIIGFVLAVCVLSQEKTSQDKWIYLGDYQELSYEIKPEMKDDYGFGKNVFIDKEYKGFYIIAKFQVNCKDNKARVISRELFAPDGKSLEKINNIEDWMQGTKTNMLGLAIKYWCGTEEIY